MIRPPIILASASPRRRELLRRLGLPFTVVVSDAPEITSETSPKPSSPRAICLANATAKARAVAQRSPHALVLGADTEVALDQRVFGKPSSRREAAEFLRALSGRTHDVITGVCLFSPELRIHRRFSETTRVTFHSLSDRQIAAYLRTVNPLDKAGGYAIQDHGEWIIEHLSGSLSNVVGLPLARVSAALHSLGYDVPPHLAS